MAAAQQSGTPETNDKPAKKKSEPDEWSPLKGKTSVSYRWIVCQGVALRAGSESGPRLALGGAVNNSGSISGNIVAIDHVPAEGTVYITVKSGESGKIRYEGITHPFEGELSYGYEPKKAV